MTYESDFDDLETRRERIMREANVRARRARRGAQAYGGRAAEGSLDFVRDHPVPTALVGLGLGWLAVSMARGGRDVRLPEQERLRQLNARARLAAQRARSRADAMTREARSGSGRVSEEARSRAAETAEIAEMRARRTAAYVRRQAMAAEHEAEEYVRSHPFVVGAVAFGLGAAVGGLLPRAVDSVRRSGGSAFDDDEDYGGAEFAEGDLQGEGDYRAAHHYREATERFAEENDPLKRGREAAEDRDKEPESFRKAEAAGRKPAEGAQSAGSGVSATPATGTANVGTAGSNGARK